MVPKGWNILSLRDLVDFTNGKAHENDVDECGQFVLVNSKFISTGGTVFKKTDSAHCPASEGDILMVMSDVPNGKAIAKCFYVTKNNEYTVNQRIARLRAIACDSHFLYYSLDRNKYYLKFDDGVKQTNLRKDEVLDCPIKVPPLPEQNKIAQILSTWDQAISTTEQLLANSQQQKKALMQQLLTGKKRLLDNNGVRFSGEWKKVKLGSVADMNSGGTPKSNVEEYYGGDIPWVSIADMTKHGKWISSTEKYLTILGLENSSARIYPENSVLYAMYASIGECSIAKVSLCSSQAILGIRPKDVLNYEFLYFFLSSLKEKIKLQGQQGTQSNLNAGMVKDFSLHIPVIEEQQHIASVLSAADEEIATLQHKLDCLKQEKKALMQQLLTGKRRVLIDA